MSQCTLQKISVALERGWAVILCRILFLEMFVISADYSPKHDRGCRANNLENRCTKHSQVAFSLSALFSCIHFCGNTRSADSNLRKAFQTLMSHENSCLYQ